MAKTFHFYNHTFHLAGMTPSSMLRGDVFTTTEAVATSEGPGCLGKVVTAPAGKYKVVCRLSYQVGTQECELIEEHKA